MTVEPVADRDGVVYWIATGWTGGANFIAEGDTEAEALQAALELVYQRHAARRVARRAEGGR